MDYKPQCDCLGLGPKTFYMGEDGRIHKREIKAQYLTEDHPICLNCYTPYTTLSNEGKNEPA